MQSTMRRWQLSVHGRANLRQVEVPIPRPGRRQALVRVRAVSLNYRDVLMVENGMGMSLEFPFVPGSDMGGEVVAVGDEVTRVRPGERVMGTFCSGWAEGLKPASAVPLGGPGPGVLSEYVVLDEGDLVQAPRTLDDAQASTLPCAGLTAWSAVTGEARIQPGQSVLIHGTGGVAVFAVQLARAQGAEVIVTTGSEAKRARVLALGAHHVLARGSDREWVEAARAITGGRGVDLVVETAGGDNLEASLTALADGGRVSIVGTLQGDVLRTSAYPVFFKRATLRGIGVGNRRGLEELIRAVDVLGLKPVIDRAYPWDELPDALSHLERGAFGKLVVTR